MARKRMIAGSVAAAMAVALIGSYESYRPNSYQDIVKVWTVCYGETKGIRKGMHFTKPECDKMFFGRLAEFESGMQKCLTNPDAIPDKPYIAFLSLSYNIGTAGFCRSSIPAKINAGKLAEACSSLMGFVKAGGKVSKGLVNRRKSEMKFCLSGI